MLLSKGYITLALAFFGVDDLPSVYLDIDISYFEEAVDFLLTLSDVSSSHVGVVVPMRVFQKLLSTRTVQFRQQNSILELIFQDHIPCPLSIYLFRVI